MSVAKFDGDPLPLQRQKITQIFLRIGGTP